MQAAQQLAKGDERSDDETRGLFSKMMFGATKYLGASLLTRDALDEWDDTFGKDIKDPAERTRARNEFANELARQFVAERTATRQNASTELKNREQGFWATVLGKGPEQIGNTLPYMLGPVGIALHFAEEAGAAGTGLAKMMNKTQVNIEARTIKEATMLDKPVFASSSSPKAETLLTFDNGMPTIGAKTPTAELMINAFFSHFSSCTSL